MSRTGRIIKVLFLCILLTIVGLVLTDRLKNVSADTAPNFAFKINAQKLTDGSTYKMKSANLQVSVLDYSTGTNTPTVPADVKWSIAKTDVVTLNTYTGDTTNIIRQGPGYETVKAEIMQNGVKYSISFVVEVDLEINYSTTGANVYVASNDKLPALQLDTVTNKTQQIHLKYTDESEAVSGAAINVNLASFKSNNPSVVSVDATGMITVQGAGSTTITVTSNSMSTEFASMSVDLTVIVVPTFGFTYKDSTGADVNCNSKYPITAPGAIYSGVPSSFTINSNASKATNLTWKIYNVVGDKSTLVTDTSKLMEYAVSQVSGSVTFTNVKAGTYEIYAFDSPNYTTDMNAPYAYMKIYVLPNITDMNIVMNVHDTYNLLDNTNIKDASSFKVLGTYDTNVALLDQSTDIITANREGSTTITLRYVTSEDLFEGLPATSVPDIKVHITVIDGIALNMTSATIYTKGTLLLDPQVTDGTYQIYWKSDDDKIATVSEDGLVTGVKPGTTTITAWQTIKGVVKKATCVITVQQSVATIVVEPNTKTLALNEYVTLHAQISPTGLKNITIQWKSSNDKVVAVTEQNGLTATVQGLTGGHAVIAAINQDNIVVGYCDITVQQPVQKITLSDTNVSVNLSMKQFQLRATVSPDNAVVKDIVWDTTDKTKATVSANGLVTLLKPGTVTIIASSKDNPAAIAYCNVNILIPVASLALNETVKTMYVGESSKLEYTLLPVNASNNGVTWVSSNTSVVTVDVTGKVTAKSSGTAVIILRSVDGGLSAYCTITVKQVATALKFDVSDLKMKTGETYQLKVTLTPKGSTENGLTWQSSDTKVAIVDDQGKITAKTSGQAIIMARTEAGGVAYCKVTVTQSVNGLVLNYSDKTIYKGESFTLEASINPSTASKLDITWKSSNDKIATIDKYGVVKGIIGGTAVITCTTTDGGYSATCVVTVKESVTSIKLNYSTYKLGLKKSFKLVAKVTNETATNQKVKWTSSNKKIATVSSTGKVYGIKSGYVTITAMALDGSEAEASCEVRVVTLVTSVKVNKSTMAMFVGESKKLKATIRPKNATYKSAKWSTSDKTIAIVEADGTVIGIKAGSVTITAQAMDSSSKKSICYVTVFDRVSSTAITLPTKTLTMVKGESKILDPVITPKNSTDKVTYSTDNAAVATVSKSSGKITAKSPGTAYITAMTESGKLATVQVTVIGLNQTKIIGEQYTNYTLTVDGATGTISWHSDNPLVAEVYSNGTVSTRAIGTTTITATVNGVKLRCTVIVKKI